MVDGHGQDEWPVQASMCCTFGQPFMSILNQLVAVHDRTKRHDWGCYIATNWEINWQFAFPTVYIHATVLPAEAITTRTFKALVLTIRQWPMTGTWKSKATLVVHLQLGSISQSFALSLYLSPRKRVVLNIDRTARQMSTRQCWSFSGSFRPLWIQNWRTWL